MLVHAVPLMRPAHSNSNLTFRLISERKEVSAVVPAHMQV